MGKEEWQLRKRKGDRKEWSGHVELFLAGNTCIYCHMPFQYIMTVFITAGPHQYSNLWPRPTSAGTSTCPEKQSFFPSIYIFTGLFFTDTRDLNGKVDIFFLLVLHALLCQHECLAGHRVNLKGLRGNRERNMQGGCVGTWPLALHQARWWVWEGGQVHPFHQLWQFMCTFKLFVVFRNMLQF